MKKLRPGRIVLILFVLLIAAGVYVIVKNQYLRQMPIGTGSKSCKIMCSSVFSSGRDPAVVEAEDLGFHPLFKIFKTKVDYENKRVTCSLLGTGLFKAEAVYREGIGAVLLAGGITAEDVRNWPAPELDREIGGTAPSGRLADRRPDDPGSPGEGTDLSRIQAAGDRLFVESDPNHILRTRALLVLYDGNLIHGIRRRNHEKHPAAELVDVDEKRYLGPCRDSGRAGETRHPSAGSGSGMDGGERPPPGDYPGPASPHELGTEVVRGLRRAPRLGCQRHALFERRHGRFRRRQAVAVSPHVFRNYSSGTANIVQRIIRKACGSDEEYWNFPRRALFDKIGMRSAVMERDAAGTFVGSSYLYATARDFARFGLLCANDGVWQGERILPEGWMAYSITPTPAASQGQYGALFWLNKGDPGRPETRPFQKIPEDVYFALGYQGQTIAVVPSRKLVVVRLGMTYDDDWGGMNVFLPEILAAIK